MIVLGIDPGVATIGFGVIRAERQKNTLIQYGVITTRRASPCPAACSRSLTTWKSSFAPSPGRDGGGGAVLHQKHHHRHRGGHGRGVILLSAERLGVPVFEYTPMQVKQAVAGYGGADKRQVMLMTQRLLNMKQVPRPDDAADALALAICHGRAATSS